VYRIIAVDPNEHGRKHIKASYLRVLKAKPSINPGSTIGVVDIGNARKEIPFSTSRVDFIVSS
jgi:hypothetical protein